MGRTLRPVGSWCGLITVLSTGCGMVGLDVPIEDDDPVLVGDGDSPNGDGDAAPGDGDGAASGDGDDDTSGDGDLGMGGAPAGSGGSGTGGTREGTGGGTGGTDSTSGGADGTGGAELGTGGSDVGTGGGASSPTFLVHDTFESGEFPATPEIRGDGHIELKGSPVHGGAYSLRVTQGTALADGATITHELPIFESGATIHFAGWVYLQAGTLPGRLDIFRFGAEGNGSLDFGVNVDGRTSVYRNGVGSTSSSAGGKYVMNQWFCIRTTIYVHDTEGTFSISINGTPTLNSNPFDTNLGVGIDYFSYGIVGANGAQQDGEVFWDDIIVDDAPVTCD